MPEEDEIPIDSDLIKVLAADTRRDILRLLQQRRMTLTEMAAALDLKKATVLEHLKRLTDANLVQRREDERLWVYYELTRRGGRIVNPVRTRFYLIVGVAVAAGLVGMAAVLVFQLAFAPSSVDQADQGTLNVGLADREVLGGSRLALSAFVTGPDGRPVDADAYLLDADAARNLQSGEGDVYGTPLESEPAGPAPATQLYAEDATMTTAPAAANDTSSDSAAGMGARHDPAAEATAQDAKTSAGAQALSPVVLLRASIELDPGTYYLYVRDALGRDNRDALAEVRVLPFDVGVTPAQWLQGLDGPAAITASSPDGPVDGTLSLTPLLGAGLEPALTVQLVDGAAAIPPDALDRMAPGAYQLRLMRESTDQWVTLGTPFEIREPGIAVFPHDILEHRDATLEVALAGLGAQALAAVPVLVDGQPVTPDVTTGSGLSVRVEAGGPGTLDMQIGRVAHRAITVQPELGLAFTTGPGPAVELRVTGAAGAPAEGVAVYLDGAALSLTDADGTVSFPTPAPGPHGVLLVSSQGHALERAIAVVGHDLFEPDPTPALEATADVRGADAAFVQVRASNPTAATQPATIVAIVDDRVVASERIVLPALGDAWTNLTIPIGAPGERLVRLEALLLPRAPATFTNSAAGQDPRPPGDEAPAGAPASKAAGTTVLLDVPADDGLADALAMRAGDDADVRDGQVLVEGPGGSESAGAPLAGPILVVVSVAVLAVVAKRRRD